VRAALVGLQLIAFGITSAVLLVRANVLRPLLDSQRPLDKVFGSLPLSSSAAVNVLSARVWDWVLFTWLAVTLFILYRKFVEARTASRIRHMYERLVHLRRRVQACSDDQKSSEWQTEMRRLTCAALDVIASDPIQRGIAALFGNHHSGYVLLPNSSGDQSVFEIVSLCCRDTALEELAADLQEEHRPSALRLQGLLELYDSCRVKIDGRVEFNASEFRTRSDGLLSGCGVVYRLERPKVFQVTRWCMAISPSYLRWAKERERTSGRRVRAGSFCLVPLKFAGRVVGVLFVGSLRPFGFLGVTVDVLEKLGRPLAEGLALGSEFRAVSLRDGTLVDVLRSGKWFEAPDVKRELRLTLRGLAREVARGGKNELRKTAVA
jgi:hypothetical protein